MCESAISLSQRRTREHSEAENVIFVKRMSDLSVWVEEQLGSVVIPQEIMSAAMSMSLRPKAPRPDYQVPKELLKKGLRPKFLEALAKKLQDANMSKDLIWRIYDKMDINRRGFLTVDQLAKAGLLSTDNGLEAVLLFANSLTIINIQRKGLVLKETLEEASQAIAHLMEKTHMLMKSKAKADLVGKRKQKKHTSDPFGFGPKIREDIEEVAAFQVGAGTTPVLPEIEASGRLKENRGVGFIEISGHEVRGHSTDFVRQVQTGDLIAFDRIHGEERTTYTLVVSAICGPTMVKVDDSSTRVMRVKQGELFPYTIIRTVVGRGIGRVPCDASLQLVVPKAQNVSSRTAHMVFDWQLQSSSRHLARAWKKRSALWRKYMRLRSIVERLDDDRLLKGVIDAWRKETVENLAKTTKETSSIGYFLNSLTGVRQRNKAQHW
uniref:Uncharacterized protein n=1 Tax=Zooxanthella nutricula TaxID=1333877 RepID=A0A7S2PZD2_9DINO